MAKVISVHSFRGGTGKSNLTANLAIAIAINGKRVAIVDTDIQSPGVHVIFGIGESSMQQSLNDFLWGKCSISDAACNVTPTIVSEANGTVYLIPSSIKAGEIARILNEGYSIPLLNDGFHKLCQDLEIDYLLIDTHPGLNRETLLSIAISDELIIILRPDQQDFQGTAVTLQVARKLDTPKISLVVNKVLPSFDFNSVQKQIEGKFQAPVTAIIPVSNEMFQLGSQGIFLLEFPNHHYSVQVRSIATKLMA
ncbi:MAG: MinD/ParA family protein [Cyanothece sp. SIO2G6]|nr:MinD/ParA family protein [Cyanothece sp. SIO2G6]